MGRASRTWTTRLAAAGLAAGAVATAAAVGACMSGASPAEPGCAPGSTVFCRCDNGEAGVQACAADGATLGSCGPCDGLPYSLSGGPSGSGSGTGGNAPDPTTVDVLLIPDSEVDAVGLYDPQDGSYLGDWLPPNQMSDPYTLSIPFNATQGLNGNIFVSDQIEDAVLEFEASGAFVRVFADATDGLDNIRGIDFFGTDLFVSVANGTVARFAANGTRLDDFIDDTTLNPFDILLESNGNTLVVDIGSPDRVRFYPAGSTTTFSHLLQRDFPQQLKPNPAGGYLVAAFSSGEVVEVSDTGVVGRSVPLPSARGVHPLGDGNWIVTGGSDSGVRVVNPANGAIVAQVREGSGFRFIEQVTLPIR
ncbi:MAG: hypothetical protein AAGN82_10815 [Myxococcota bacterium]